jgi:CheY-like chemotaxis protein
VHAARSLELRTVSVLIVDDDADSRQVLADLIEEGGYSVVTARDGVEALQWLGKVQPQLIVLDVIMPRMDGAEFRQQQRRNPAWIRIPTVVMTGAADEPMLDVAVADTLRKPVHGAEVMRFVALHCTK